VLELIDYKKQAGALLGQQTHRRICAFTEYFGPCNVQLELLATVEQNEAMKDLATALKDVIMDDEL